MCSFGRLCSHVVLSNVAHVLGYVKPEGAGTGTSALGTPCPVLLVYHDDGTANNRILCFYVLSSDDFTASHRMTECAAPLRAAFTHMVQNHWQRNASLREGLPHASFGDPARVFGLSNCQTEVSSLTDAFAQPRFAVWEGCAMLGPLEPRTALGTLTWRHRIDGSAYLEPCSSVAVAGSPDLLLVEAALSAIASLMMLPCDPASLTARCTAPVRQIGGTGSPLLRRPTLTAQAMPVA